MNKKDIKIIDEMISEAWDDNNAFCRKLKDYLGKHFSHIPEIKERCKDPYWKEGKPLINEILKKALKKGELRK